MADSSDYKTIMKQGKLVGKTTFVSDKSLLNEPAVTLSFSHPISVLKYQDGNDKSVRFGPSQRNFTNQQMMSQCLCLLNTVYGYIHMNDKSQVELMVNIGIYLC